MVEQQRRQVEHQHLTEQQQQQRGQCVVAGSVIALPEKVHVTNFEIDLHIKTIVTYFNFRFWAI